MEFDLQELKKQIKEATKKSFKENVKKYGYEICSFALVSDDGAMTVVPFTNTKSHLKKMQLEDPKYKEMYEFEPAEWLTSDGANTAFDNICDTLSKQLDKGDLDFVSFKNSLFETCVKVLEKLRADNFFTQELGKDVLILFSISDTVEPKENLIKWAKQLNNAAEGKRIEDYLSYEYE